MNLKNLHNVYFIGIGGIGMSALARYFLFMEKRVLGYDKTEVPLTRELEAMGIDIHYEDSVVVVHNKQLDPTNTLVVYTPAVPKDHAELNYFKDHGFSVMKRSEVLGLITENSFCFAVAGTHGKTTTSCILAHILKESGIPIMAFLGGISEDFNSNFLLEGTDYSVVEADEYDRSYLRLSPNIACITSMDADHLDIYGSRDALVESFVDFTKRLKPGGKLFVRNGLPLEGITYGIEDDSDYCIQRITIKNGTYIFDIKTPEITLKDLRFHKPGRHNLLNGLVAFAMAMQLGIAPERLAKALASFKGVQRRFSYQIQTKSFVFIDDYAHHPTEINAVHDAIRELYPGRQATAVFQPHLFSRTKDFAEDFAKSLSCFDRIILLDIYPAREKPIPGITSEWLLQKISNPKKELVSKQTLSTAIKTHQPEILVTMGAGDIGLEIAQLKKELEYEI
ncbi:UDP-N-acetylmuramate--L-alanine ligase [Arenibacter sp. GZD96]|uniref:UDP-N-acetylmuramate--L-alanine ligase n=1 Tax=Aurantibrevibacter litoralis TaxID=3106030 RepID=UPI002AFE113F|nr:UDP-N-acetylmuramate--L-alanine ligase [Arenibacter sp. GZD-96]MEA1786773.1 UDP-N-acetylmuramate--L-alanine ligase [Arenibacter sp. GZD-96]